MWTQPANCSPVSNAYSDTASAHIGSGSHRGHVFLDLPVIQLSVSAQLNPHQGIVPRSVETSLDFGTVNTQVDVIQRLLKKLKENRVAKDRAAAALAAMHRSRMSKHPAPGSGWKSPLSPISSFMGSLSVW